MLNDGVMASDLIIREWLNGSLFPLSANLAAIIAVFLWDSFAESRKEHTPRWWKMPGVPTACVLFWIFGAESARSLCVWFILRVRNSGGEVPPSFQSFSDMVFAFALVVLVIAFLRCTYLFTPPKWAHRFWIYSAISTAGFLAFSRSLTYFGY